MPKKEITARTLKQVRYRNASIPLASALAIVVAFISPVLSTAAYALVGVVMGTTSFQVQKRRAVP